MKSWNRRQWMHSVSTAALGTAALATSRSLLFSGCTKPIHQRFVADAAVQELDGRATPKGLYACRSCATRIHQQLVVHSP